MPLYEYQCDACGSIFEKIQKFADQPLTVHEDCGGPVHRLLTAPAFQFKGTGWYVTDYGRGKAGPNGGGKASDGKESKETKDGKDSKEGKESKDSKPESSAPKSTEASSSSTPAAKSDK